MSIFTGHTSEHDPHKVEWNGSSLYLNSSNVGSRMTPMIDRAGVHAGAAADALQRMPEIGHAKPAASPVVNQHDVQFPTLPRAGEMGGILREWSAYRTSREQPQKHTHVFHSRDQLLNADARNMERRHRSPNVGVAFIRADHEGSRFGNGEIAARHTRSRH